MSEDTVRNPAPRTPEAKAHARLRDKVQSLGLEAYVTDLELNGFTVVPPEVTGLTEQARARLIEVLLAKSEELVGCPFSVESGAAEELDFGEYRGTLELISGAKPSQFQLVQLCTYDRAFRDLAVNEVAVTLMRYLIGFHAARFSSHNCFVKWAGEGYGESLGLHCDQGQVPQPWGRISMTANCNWCLTDYTLENGAFACVPGSHLRGRSPALPDAVAEAVPVECPAGSLIAFHGQLWHGAYPRSAPGLRLTIANYYRHTVIQPQDDVPNHFPRDLADDCDDPTTFRRLAGFGLPYQGQVLPLPKAKARSEA